jgi:hypothetical protein
MGNITRAALNLVKKAIINKGNIKIKNFELFLTANTMKKNAQIKKAPQAKSEYPNPESNIISGKVAKSNPPKKLSILLKCRFKRK